MPAKKKDWDLWRKKRWIW